MPSAGDGQGLGSGPGGLEGGRLEGERWPAGAVVGLGGAQVNAGMIQYDMRSYHLI
jgi:hypothetical protein